MFDSPPTSQLTLMRLSTSTKSKCTVFCLIAGSLSKFSLEFDDATTVKNVITSTLKLLQEQNTNLKVDKNEANYSLYACKKNGRKCSDLPSFENKQRIELTGVKTFYLTSP